LDADVVKFIAKLGIKADSHWTEYKGSNSVLDSFFGIKYLITRPEEAASSLYTEVYADEFTRVYKNPYALSLAFASSPKVNDVTFELPTDLVDYEYLLNEETDLYEWVLKDEFSDTLWSPFERMNAILSAISGKDVSVYEGIEHTMETTSTVRQEDSLWNHYVFKSEIGETSACITFNLTATKDGHIYCFFPTKYSREIKVMVNEKFLHDSDGDYIYQYDNNANISIILDLGSYKTGDKVMVDVYIDAYGEFYLTNNTPYFCYIDEAELASVMTDIRKGNFNITKFSDDYIEGSITTDGVSNTVLFTIPYDKGWNIKVDGKKVETYETLECLMAFDLPNEAGTYEITMKYFPSCYKLGIAISIISLASFIAIILLAKKSKDEEKKNTSLFKIKDALIPLPTDVRENELSLIDLERQEEAEEELMKKASRKKKKGKK
ncbi:MAG: YfhO family protein, partial [Clostridia bacterium]|nr:YfhO family protein [Clostridia bacterium]